MVMRTLLSADNEIGTANAASTGSRSRLAAYFAVCKMLHTGKDNQLGAKCIYDSLTFSVWFSVYNRKTSSPK